jgi:hypothetical protein
VPEGLQYYTLSAQLSELQLVFLYRFLQENLNYITTMLAMRLPPLEAGSGAGGASDAAAVATAGMPPASPSKAEVGGQQPGDGEGSAAVAPAQEALQPFVLLLDVQADAPNICLPRSSGEACWCLLGMHAVALLQACWSLPLLCYTAASAMLLHSSCGLAFVPCELPQAAWMPLKSILAS